MFSAAAPEVPAESLRDLREGSVTQDHTKDEPMTPPTIDPTDRDTTDRERGPRVRVATLILVAVVAEVLLFAVTLPAEFDGGDPLSRALWFLLSLFWLYRIHRGGHVSWALFVASSLVSTGLALYAAPAWSALTLLPLVLLQVLVLLTPQVRAHVRPAGPWPRWRGPELLALVVVLVLVTSFAAFAAGSPAPSNDDAADAVAVTALPAAFSLDVAGATLEDGEQDDVCFETDNTVWYAVSLPTEQRLTMDATGSDFEVGLVVFASTGGQDEILACGVERLTFTAHAGITYYVQVGAHMGLQPGQGHLELQFREAVRTTGKPTTANTWTATGAVLAAWEEELPHGRRLVQVSAMTVHEHVAPGGPEAHADVAVEVHDLVVDPDTGVLTHDEWFGLTRPTAEQLRIDPSLRSAAVDAPLVFEHTRLVVTPDGEADSEDLGEVPGTVDVRWSGVGPLLHDRAVAHHKDVEERSTFVDIERRRAAHVDADVRVDGRSVIDGAPWHASFLDGRSLNRSWSRTAG
jgi:hypothetical protein